MFMTMGEENFFVIKFIQIHLQVYGSPLVATQPLSKLLLKLCKYYVKIDDCLSSKDYFLHGYLL